MSSRLIIDGNSVYEIDEDCMEQEKKQRAGRKTPRYDTERKKKNKPEQ